MRYVTKTRIFLRTFYMKLCRTHGADRGQMYLGREAELDDERIRVPVRGKQKHIGNETE